MALVLSSACDGDYLDSVTILEKTYLALDKSNGITFHFRKVFTSLGLCILTEIQKTIRTLASNPSSPGINSLLVLTL